MATASPDTPEFTIIGSGLAGALMACFLGKAGRRVDLYERRPDPRGETQERGRSINLALSVRGIEALRQIGLADEVLKHAIPMPGRMIHSPSGALSFQPYGKDESQAINSVSRGGLNLILVNAAAKYDNVRMHFRQRCTGIDLATGTLDFTDGAAASKAETNTVIGADGVYSAIRSTMQRHERFDYSQDYQSHGYKELSIPPGPGGTFMLEKHALHIWPRRSFMMIALPNIDGSFTCTLFLHYDGADGFEGLRTDADVRRFFERHFPDAVPLMPTLIEDFFANPTGPLVTVRCRPWHHKGRAVLVGDAAHAVVPFLGQGMNCAFEDCVVLDRCLAGADDLEAAFADYEAKRKEHADALADMAIDNFLEMRDRVGSRWFRLRKRGSLLLQKILGGLYVPLYSLIQFTTTPYADARRRARLQGRAVGAALIALLLALAVGVYFLVRP